MSLLNNALSGALAAQIGLDVTSQNVSNMATDGYTRQGAIFSSVQPTRTGKVAAGDGVTVNSLIRFSDNYKSQQMWRANSELGQRNVAQSYFTQLEQVMGDDSASIDAGIDDFFGALNSATVDPASSPLRQQVLSSADALSQRFNSMQQVLTSQRAAIGQQRSTAVDQVSSMSSDIAGMNRKITAAQAAGLNTSALVDDRDRKIDSLSSLVNVQVTDQADGSRNVTLRTGQPLVMGSTAATVSVTTNPDSSQTLKLKFATETFTLTTGSLGGQIGGLDDYERNTLDVMSTSISQVAQGITDSVNTALAAGYGTDPTVTTPGSGKPLFQYNPTTRQMSITPNLVTKDLAFSSNPATPGDSSVLQTIIGLQKQPLTNVTALGSVLLGDAYTQLMGRVATSSQQNNASLGTAETVRTQTQADWKSTSGVNQDEEAVNLIQYQQMYNANMKVIAVANQLFDSTLAILT